MTSCHDCVHFLRHPNGTHLGCAKAAMMYDAAHQRDLPAHAIAIRDEYGARWYHVVIADTDPRPDCTRYEQRGLPGFDDAGCDDVCEDDSGVFTRSRSRSAARIARAKRLNAVTPPWVCPCCDSEWPAYTTTGRERKACGNPDCDLYTSKRRARNLRNMSIRRPVNVH